MNLSKKLLKAYAGTREGAAASADRASRALPLEAVFAGILQ
jgi:hypothetical protein